MNKKKIYVPILISFGQLFEIDVLNASNNGLDLYDNWVEDIF